MNMVQRFGEFILEKNLFDRNDQLFLAVSGGIDSVTLCELCHQSGYTFEILHCNFQLRGEESERDEKFVEQLALHYKAPFHLRKFDTMKYADEMKISIQEAARNLRYEWFRMVLQKENKENKNTRLLTAHHANDSIETLLMNFFKGTGIHGLQGIPARNGNIRRPMLFAKRKEIEHFVNENHLQFVEDHSNASDKYTRNYFRHKIIPALQEVFPNVEENLMNNLIRFHEVEILFKNAVTEFRRKLIEEKEGEYHLPVLKVLKTPAYKTVLFEILKDFGFLPGQMQDVISLLHAGSGKYVESHSHRILRNRNWLIISAKKSFSQKHILIENVQESVLFENGILHLESKDWLPEMKIGLDESVALIDIADVHFPLLLRPWKTGDYFYPLGMKHKKKLSRFFVDQKLSLIEKEKIWVIESRKKILWIVGMRIDDRFKITNATKKILRIQFSNHQ